MSSLVWSVDLMVKSLTEAGFEVQRSGICVGLTPDHGKRIRYQAIARDRGADRQQGSTPSARNPGQEVRGHHPVSWTFGR